MSSNVLAYDFMAEHDELSKLVVGNTPDVLIATDIHGQILFVSPSVEQAIGLTPEDLIGTSFFSLECLSAEDREVTRLAFLRLFEDIGQPGRIETRCRTLDGTWGTIEVFGRAFVDQSGRPMAVGVVRDVTERRRLETALAQTEERYRQLVDTTTDIIFSYDRNLCLTGLNRAAAELLGMSPDEAMGRLVADLGFSASMVGHFRDAAEAVSLSGSCIDLLVEGVVPDGNERTYAITASPILDACGDMVGIRSSARDVTEKKRLEQALARSEEQLLRAQGMEAIGRVAGTIAHDLRNYLTAVLGYCDLILSGSEISVTTLREDVGEIQAIARRGSDFVSQIMGFARPQPLESQVLCLNGLIQSCMPLLVASLGERITIVAHLCPDLGRVKVSGDQFERALINLAMNAKDAMPDGGTLTLETRNVAFEEIVAPAPDAVPGPYVLLTVADTGVGMDDETRRHIFEPFFTTKGVGRGTGLGLSAVYSTVSQAGGMVLVDSQQGRGTTFHFLFPRAQMIPLCGAEHAAGLSDVPRLLAAADSGGRRV